MTTTIVEGCTTAQQIQELSSFITSQQSTEAAVVPTLAERCAELLKQTEESKARALLLEEGIAALFASTTVTDDDVEGCFNVLMSLAVKAESTSLSAFATLRSKLIAVSTKPLLRLRILGNMFNFVDSQQQRFETFTAIVKLAAESGNSQVVVPHFAHIDEMLDEWKATPAQRRELYTAACAVLSNTPQQEQQQLLHELLPKLLATFEEGIYEESSADEAAAKAIALAVTLPEVYRLDHLAAFRAVRALERAAATPERQALYKLLCVFISGSLSDWKQWVETGASKVTSVTLDQASCEHKIRLLTLVSFCAAAVSNGAKEVPLAALAKALEVSEEAVEEWVVEAVAKNLISGKIDQQTKGVKIGFCLQRVFDVAQWKDLAGKLTAWRQAVGSLHTVLQQTAEAKQNAIENPPPPKYYRNKPFKQ